MRFRVTLGVAHGGVLSSEVREHPAHAAETTRPMRRRYERLMCANDG
jgi:hypothetical protein